MRPDMDPIEPARVSWTGTTPRAPDFDDHYFSVDDGIGEARTVFLTGNRLAERFESLGLGHAFTIGETGFGTGLNLLLAAALFEQRAAPGSRLHLVSAEKHPMGRDDLDRSLSAWPALAPQARSLVDQWPPAVCGYHRLWLSDRVDLTLMFGDASAMWAAQDATVDAWFLDGFAPRRNPSMWTPGLFAQLAARSRPGATLATFSAAGDVRRGLTEAGFEVERQAGHGRKRHRLEARWPGQWQPRTVPRGKALIVGGGLAGCTAAHALARRGWRCRVIDAGGIAAGASGNRSGVVYTTPSGQATPQNRFYQSSWLHALRWFRRADAEQHGLARFEGVEQVLTDERHRRKIEGALASGHWPRELLQPLAEDRVLLVDGGVVRPADWCRALIDRDAIEVRTGRAVDGLVGSNGVRLADGEVLEADVVVVCASAATASVLGGGPLPIRTIRGQVTEVAETPASRSWERAVCHTGYVAPSVDGLHCIGATFDLHQQDPTPRAADDAINLAALKRWCPERWAELGAEDCAIRGSRVGFRCTSRDYLPLVGRWPGGPSEAKGSIWLSLAFGSRGLSSTPLAAERIADALAGAPAPTDAAIRDALEPGRFERRASANR